MAARYGRSFTPHQIGKSKSAAAAYHYEDRYHLATLPDVTVWTRPGEHHEIKHKDPTRDGMFGLEQYRVDALRWFAEETGQSVYYTIHCYDFVPLSTRQERKFYRKNHESHWLTASILDLLSREYRVARSGSAAVSIVNGKRREGVKILYWPMDAFIPLSALWDFVARPLDAPILQGRLL
jgi:hypothetical protein